MLVVALPARFPLRFLIAVVLGALHAASFVDDTTWPLELATLAALVALVTRAARESDDLAGARGARRAAAGGFRLGFGFGLGWFLTGVSWIYISLHTYGEMNPLIAGAATVALCAYLALYPALACAGFAWFRHARAGAPRLGYAAVFAFAALWTASELARGFVFTGFPWLASGYAHVAGPLAGYAPLVGVYGLSGLAAAVAAAVVFAGERIRRGPGSVAVRSAHIGRLFAVVVVVGLPLAGHGLSRIDWTTPAGAPIRVRLLQGNVPLDVKFDEGRFDAIADDFMNAVEAKPADLIVLPETAFPRFLDDLPEALGERLARDVRTLHAAIAFGIPIREGEDRYFNSVVALAPERPAAGTSGAAANAAAETGDLLAGVEAQRYDKSHLVPFGEFIPTGFHWFVRLMNMPLGDFTRGPTDPKPMKLAGQQVAFNVCYEDLFGAEIIRQAGAANILVNVSNVAWFGNSWALPQHLDISRMRSIETGRPMLRSTNTGMTASIDPHGRVLAKLEPFTVGSLDVSVQGMTGTTPYVRWGDRAAVALIAAFGVAAAWLTRRSPMRHRRPPAER